MPYVRTEVVSISVSAGTGGGRGVWLALYSFLLKPRFAVRAERSPIASGVTCSAMRTFNLPYAGGFRARFRKAMHLMQPPSGAFFLTNEIPGGDHLLSEFGNW